jgi:hypothetical protein
MASMLDMDRQMVKMEVRTKCMMKSLMIISMVAFPTVASAQYHSLSGGPVTDIPAYSWENPGWSQGSTAFNASPHQLPTATTPTMVQSFAPDSRGTAAGGGFIPPSRLNNDFGNMD